MPIYHRDAFLNTVAEKLGRLRRVVGVTRPVWDDTPQSEQLQDCGMDERINILKKHCEVIHTRVDEVPRAHLGEALSRAFTTYECRSVIRSGDPRFSEYGLDGYFAQQMAQGMDIHVWDRARGHENIEFAERADVGITFSELTLAESATVVVYSEGLVGRSVSLLPKNYIAIIPRSTIVPRLTQAAQQLHGLSEEGMLPTCIHFISGPSNSADIEMNLVVGVHGPVEVTYIIVGDK